MDEKDAISILNMIEAHGDLPVKAKEMAINVLEEVQQYRAIGTPKKIKDLLEKAIKFYETLKEKYPIFLTRNLLTAKNWVRNHAKGSRPMRRNRHKNQIRKIVRPAPASSY